MASCSLKYNKAQSSFAKAFTGLSMADLFKFMESVWEDFDDDAFPHLSERESWEVYLLYKGGYFTHYSLFFTLSCCSVGFAIHLNKNQEDKVVLLLERIDLQDPKYSALQKKCLGTTEALTAREVIIAAHNRLVQMGDYHALLNNCQDYCQRLAKDFKLNPILTEADVGIVAGTGSVAVAVVGVIISFLLK